MTVAEIARSILRESFGSLRGVSSTSVADSMSSHGGCTRTPDEGFDTTRTICADGIDLAWNRVYLANRGTLLVLRREMNPTRL